MIKKFENFSTEEKVEYLYYYGFDWDDNILYMPTVIHMEKKIGDSWQPVDISTKEFAEVRSDVENWRIINGNAEEAFCEFRDQTNYGLKRGETAFLEDLKVAISQRKLGPSWNDFIECLSNGTLFAIITARGHESPSMRTGVEWIIDNVLSKDELFSLYNNCLRFAYLFGQDEHFPRVLTGKPSQNDLIKVYLDHCEFVGVSAPSRGGSPSNPEKAKEEVFLEFCNKVNTFISELNQTYTHLGVKWVAKIGFSDDDVKNKEHVENIIQNLKKETFPNIIQFTVKGTKDPENITKKVRTMTETSHQTPGLESSVLKFTQFGNMASQLNPQGPIDRQDDFANQMRRQTKYLTKTSKEILGNKKKKKKSSK